MLKQTNVIVLDGPMNFDLTHQLLLCSALREARLLDNLGCMHELSLTVDELVALGKASLAKIFSFYVPFDSNLVVRLFEFLFYDLLLLNDSASCVRALLLHVYLFDSLLNLKSKSLSVPLNGQPSLQWFSSCFIYFGQG